MSYFYHLRKIFLSHIEVETHFLTVGYDFRFGKDRKGDLNLLKKLSSLYSFNLSIIEPVINAETSEKYSHRELV